MDYWTPTAIGPCIQSISEADGKWPLGRTVGMTVDDGEA